MSEQLTRDPKRTYISTAPDGSMIIEQGDQTKTFENPIKVQQRTQEAKSAASARLARLTAGTPENESNVIKLDLASDEEPWYIRRLALEDVTRVGIYGGRDEKGNLNLNDEGAFTGLLAAMLFVSVCDEHGAPFFIEFGEAFVQAANRNPAVVNVNADLFANILKHNPGVLPEAQKDEKKTSHQSGSNSGTPMRDSTRSVVSAPPRGSRRRRSTGKRR